MACEILLKQQGEGEDAYKEFDTNDKGQLRVADVLKAFDAELVEFETNSGRLKVLSAGNDGWSLASFAAGTKLTLKCRTKQEPLHQRASSPAPAAAIELDTDATTFWQGLKQVKPEPGQFMELPASEAWLGKGHGHQKLLVRKCYPELWAIICVLVASTGNVLLMGTPGTGKTAFQLYVLVLLAAMGKTAVLDWEGVDGRFLFKGDQVWHGPADAFRHELSLRDTWFLVDAKSPPDVNAITLLTTSPRHDLNHNFAKYRADIRYMPTWTLAELQAARPLYPGVEPDLVEELYAKWGGSVRYVLQFAIIPSLQLHLQQAIDGASFHELFVSVGQLDSKREVSHRLVHIEVTSKDYIQHRINFASPYVGQLVGDRLARDSVEAVERFIRSTRDLGDVAAMRGILFERLSHHFMYTREFDMEERDLESNTGLPSYHNSPKERIDLEKGASLQQLKDKAGAYIIPRARNYASIDSLMLPDRAFQCTVSATHPVKSVGLKRVMDETGTDEILLTFVVPPDQFATFKKQEITGVQYAELRRVKQRVCQLPVHI